MPLTLWKLTSPVDSKSLDIIAGDSNIDGLLKEQLQDTLTAYPQIVQELTHVGEYVLDHV